MAGYTPGPKAPREARDLAFEKMNARLDEEEAQRVLTERLLGYEPIMEDLADELEGAMSGMYDKSNPDGSLQEFSERYVKFIGAAAGRLGADQKVEGRLHFLTPGHLTAAMAKALESFREETEGDIKPPPPETLRFDGSVPVRKKLATVVWSLSRGVPVYTKVERDSGKILVFTTRLREGTRFGASFADYC